MTPELLIAEIKKQFKQELASKTSWGRNDVQIAHERALTKSLLKFINFN